MLCVSSVKYGLGNAAHSSAASENGPRFDNSLTSEQRRAYENGAWLCTRHATLVDKDPEHYTVHDMRDWQLVAEKRTRQAMVASPLSSNINYQDVCNKLDAFLTETNKIHLSWFLGYPTRMEVSRTTVNNILRIVDLCSGYNWRPSNPLHSLDPQTADLQMQAVQYLSAILIEVRSDHWYFKDGAFDDCYAIQGVDNPWSTQQELTQQQLAADQVTRSWQGYLECISKLQSYATGKHLSTRSIF